MADEYIRRQDAIDDLHTQLMYRMGSDDMKRRLDDWVKTLPPADVVKVVRCRECQFWQDAEAGVVEVPICARPQAKGEKLPFVMEIGGKGFCSYGERREG